MKYCGLTMKRQLKTQEYDLKDWVVNATTLADAFLGKDHFAQAEYLLFAAYHLLPDDLTKKKGLRGMVQMQIGKYYQKRLEVGVGMLINGYELEVDKLQERFVEFPELDMKWPEITQCSSIDDAKTLFRLANTQFKRALERFVLDGFVTEHVTIKQGMSQLYRALTKLETDMSRV